LANKQLRRLKKYTQLRITSYELRVFDFRFLHGAGAISKAERGAAATVGNTDSKMGGEVHQKEDISVLRFYRGTASVETLSA
jgi:hypothetical protein